MVNAEYFLDLLRVVADLFAVHSQHFDLGKGLVLDLRRQDLVGKIQQFFQIGNDFALSAFLGSDLHLQLLSLDGGQVRVDGTVDSMTYEDDEPEAVGFFARLFG